MDWLDLLCCGDILAFGWRGLAVLLGAALGLWVGFTFGPLLGWAVFLVVVVLVVGQRLYSREQKEPWA